MSEAQINAVDVTKPKAEPKLLVTMGQMEKKLRAHSASDQRTILNYLYSRAAPVEAGVPASN